ncbi:MAG: hypothetical protein K1X36_00595 [Pyrinomonadaceae bacterium]|nr:hypothetical protein [Pyrinomonadaceae bacterium]
MVRKVLGVIGGFFAWMTVWVGSERILSAIFPNGYGVHQAAFQAAVENGASGFTVDTTLLLSHLVQGLIVSVMAGAVAALIAGENKRAPLILGLLLAAFGLLIVVLSWPYVPVWYHVVFTAMLLPLAIVGGRLINNN